MAPIAVAAPECEGRPNICLAPGSNDAYVWRETMRQLVSAEPVDYKTLTA